MIKVAILDDHPLILSGMKSVLDYEDDIEVLGTYNNSSMLFLSFSNALPDVLLLDLQLKDETGESILSIIQKDYKSINVIILTNIDNIKVVKNLINIGAKGYMLKTSPVTKLPNAIRAVHANEIYIADEIKDILAQATLSAQKTKKTNKFTKREIEILQLISEEHTTQEIADLLELSNRTIDNYRLGLMQKLDAKNMIGMVKKALMMGLIK